MTGFVDPAFKRIKVTEPNFFIWRISKSEVENYEAKQIRKEYFGHFYDEDSYIVYSSAPVKKVLGRANRGSQSKMEIHIHFWLGSHITEDEQKRTIIKVMELDEVLEGAGTLHREMQGYESNRFLSYFKNGMYIKRGEIATVLKKNMVDQNERLFALSLRASTVTFTEQPSTCWSCMKSDGIFVLEKRCNVFVWIGNKVSHKDRQLEKIMDVYNTNKKVIWVFDGKENELATDELADFEKSLELGWKFLWNTEEKDFLSVQTEFRSITELYKVVQGTFSTITRVKQGPLEQSDLDSMDVCIVDHCMNGIWIWVCKKLADTEKSRSINIAISYLEKKRSRILPEERKLNVHRVVEGSEPQEFKLLFKSWIDTYPAHPDHYFLKKPGKPVNMNFSADILEESPFLAAETQLLDCGGGEMSVAIVYGDKLVYLNPEEFGIFHSDYKYFVCYTYNVNGEKKKILYFWLGNKLSLQDNEDICPPAKHFDEYKDVSVRVQIEQYKETPHFYAIFRGKIIVLNSPLPVSKDGRAVLDRYPLLLFKVIGGDVLNTMSIEVTPGAHSFCSGSVFIARTPTLSFIWCGASSKGDVREMAKKVANKWTREYKVIVEGYESKEFRIFMEKHGLGMGPNREEIVPPQINVPATLYKCSLSEIGFRVSEVLNFDRSDLGSSDIIILDAWDIIFVWIGKDVTEKNSSKDRQIALNYLQSDPCGRARYLPIVYVTENQEPPIFRGYFPAWPKTGQDTLKEVPRGETLSDVQPKCNAENLSNYEFWSKFGIKREVYHQYPQWKQRYKMKVMGFCGYENSAQRQ